MITRVRYNKQEDGTLKSKEMMGSHEVVLVTIDPKTMVYRINSKEGMELTQGGDKTLAVIKKLVKRDLKRLGVQFHDEVRERKEDAATPEQGE